MNFTKFIPCALFTFITLFSFTAVAATDWDSYPVVREAAQMETVTNDLRRAMRDEAFYGDAQERRAFGVADRFNRLMNRYNDALRYHSERADQTAEIFASLSDLFDELDQAIAFSQFSNSVAEMLERIRAHMDALKEYY